jgi:hypothetical protein
VIKAFNIIHDSAPLPKIKGRGRKLGDGSNCRVLNKMVAGDSIAGLNRKQVASFRTSAMRLGYKVNSVCINGRSFVVRLMEKKEKNA